MKFLVPAPVICISTDLVGGCLQLLGSFGMLTKDASIVLVGLDNAGKTTCLYKL